MIYIVGQIWIWLLVALVLGALLAWLWMRFSAAARAEEQLGPWRDRVSSLEHERDTLRRDLGEARDRATESEAQLSALRDDLAESEAKIESLALELDTLKSEPSEAYSVSGNGAMQTTAHAEPESDVAPALDIEIEIDTAPDRLSRIKGIGQILEGQLNALGITTFAQIAALTDDDVARIDEALGFKGRILRDDWIGQARKLLPDG